MTMAAYQLEPTPYEHATVMPAEVVAALSPRLQASRTGAVFVDVTAGGGGHSAALLAACPQARVIAFDRDARALEATGARLSPYPGRYRVVRAAFSEVEARLRELEPGGVDGLVADLGVSSAQLDDPARGMSFRFEGPLDMRMDTEHGETALELIARLSQDELANTIFYLGEERRSRRVARCIKQALADSRLETTQDLRRAVVRAVGPRRVGGIDPATKTFQALRIAVNEELAELEGLLGFAPRVLRPGGVASIISFHSLEDRLVKRAFLERSLWQRLTNKPLVASDEERASNPRARSAKLRSARRVSVELEVVGEVEP